MPANIPVIEDILTRIKETYQPILPNCPAPLPQGFSKGDVSTLLRHIQVFVQLLVQNALLSGNARSIALLERVNEKMLLESASAPCRKVDLGALLPGVGPVELREQASLWQEPLLMYFMGGQYQGRRLGQPREAALQELRGLVPLADAKYLPCFETKPTKPRCRFSGLEDNLLYVGVSEHSSRNLRVLKELYLPEKECHEIKHRYKNLSCVKAEDSAIKRWRFKQRAPLTPAEEQTLLGAVARHGEKWPLIARYYLVDRSRSDLEAYWREFEPKKRKATVPDQDPPEVRFQGRRFRVIEGLTFEYDSL
jgi:hypothetical protein